MGTETCDDAMDSAEDHGSMVNLASFWNTPKNTETSMPAYHWVYEDRTNQWALEAMLDWPPLTDVVKKKAAQIAVRMLEIVKMESFKRRYGKQTY